MKREIREVCAEREESKSCQRCGAVFGKKYGLGMKNWAKQKFCSLKCYGRVRDPNSPDTKTCAICAATFKRQRGRGDNAHWEKRKFCSPACAQSTFSTVRLGQWKSATYRQMMVDAHKGQASPFKGVRYPDRSGPSSPAWRGEDTCYAAKHSWITRTKGKPTHCDECRVTGVKIQWANRDHLYSRNPDDYRPLCVICHRRYDKEMRNEARN